MTTKHQTTLDMKPRVPPELQSDPARALWLVDVDDYETTAEAVRAALATCRRYQCPRCELRIFTRPVRCRECGEAGDRFEVIA